MVRPLPKPLSGYIGPDGVMRDSLVEHLVVTVREHYATGSIVGIDALEAAVAAALVGDHARATDSPFAPMQMQVVYRP